MKSKIKYSLFIIVFILALSLSVYAQENNQYVNYNVKAVKINGSRVLTIKIPHNKDFYFNEGRFDLRDYVYDSYGVRVSYSDILYMRFYAEKGISLEHLPYYYSEIIEKNQLPDIKSGDFTFKIYKGIRKALDGELSYFIYSSCPVSIDYTYHILIESNEDFSIEEVKPFMDIEYSKDYSNIISSFPMILLGLFCIFIFVVSFMSEMSRPKDGIATTGTILDVKKKVVHRDSWNIEITVKYTDLEGNEVIAKENLFRLIYTDYFDSQIGKEINIRYSPEDKSNISSEYNSGTLIISFISLLFGVFLISFSLR